MHPLFAATHHVALDAKVSIIMSTSAPFPRRRHARRRRRPRRKSRKYVETLTPLNVSPQTAPGATYAGPAMETYPSTCAPKRVPAAPVRSPLDLEFWSRELADHPDRKFVDRLLTQITDGISIGYQGNEFPYSSPNWPSAYKYRESVRSNILSNAAKGRLDGPFDTPPHPHFRISPLGAFPKKRSSKIRVIHDLSWPPGKSINECINKYDYAFSSSTIADAVDRCLKYKTPFMVKADITDAYMHCMIRPEERHLLGFAWDTGEKTEFWQYAVLPFGMSSSPKLFNDYADALNYIMIKNGASRDTVHYLDDFWSVSASKEEAEASLKLIMDIIRNSGMEIQASKTVEPTRVIEYLGIIIDTNVWQLRISAERLKEIKKDLIVWKGKVKCTKRQLLSLIGKLMFCANVVRDGRKFIGRLIDLSKRVKHLHHNVKLNKQAQADINWWLLCMDKHNGTSMISTEWDLAQAHLIFTDASDGAAAAVSGRSWCYVPFEKSDQWMANMSIAWRELFAVVICIATFGESIQGQKVAMYTDNQAVYWCINTGKSRNTDLMCLIRTLYYYTTLYNIDYRAYYICTNDNIIADALSRGNFGIVSQFGMDRVPTAIPQILYDI